MNRVPMQKVIDGRRYDTETATLLAHDVYWDGHNFERDGRNTWLYRTPRGRYFVVTGTFWQGERDRLTPLSEEDAQAMYERLPEHEVDYGDALPNVTVEDA